MRNAQQAGDVGVASRLFDDAVARINENDGGVAVLAPVTMLRVY
jgi:hypothetical protein